MSTEGTELVFKVELQFMPTEKTFTFRVVQISIKPCFNKGAVFVGTQRKGRLLKVRKGIPKVLIRKKLPANYKLERY